MKAPEARRKACAQCSSTLTNGNAWLLPEKFGRGYHPWCISCQSKYYTYLSSVVGYKLAVFFCAAAFNVPYIPKMLNEGNKYNKSAGSVWGGYLTALRKNGYASAEKGFAQFSDGETDISKAFSGRFETIQVGDEMLADEEYASGKLAQSARWGKGPEEAPYTMEDYEALERVYEAMTDGRAYISAQTEMVIQNICKWTLERDKCMAKKEYDDAKKIDSMIEKAKESEQIRKKDELPQDRARLDDIVQAIERAGLHVMDYDELVKELATHMFHTPYGYTRDAADQMLLYIYNATAWNEGRAEVASLPPEFSITDTLGEFAAEPDETEKNIYRELHLSPLNMGGQ